jgi:hypothetical protein
MDGTGFHVDIDVLDEAGSGITQSVADQDKSELADVCRDRSTYGHAGVHDAMKNFCERWNDGLDLLTGDAKAIGDMLSRVARAYRAVDAAAARSLSTDPGLRAENE